MATRHRIAAEEELSEDGSRVIAAVDGLEIAVFRIGGELYAAANYCVHQGGPLCEGGLRGRYGVSDGDYEWTYDTTEKNIVCPWHGWKFDLTTGKNINDSRYTVPTYDVEVDDGGVYVVRS